MRSCIERPRSERHPLAPGEYAGAPRLSAVSNLLDVVNPRHGGCAAAIATSARHPRFDFQEEDLLKAQCAERRYAYDPVRPFVPFAHRAAYMIRFPIEDRGIMKKTGPWVPKKQLPAAAVASPESRGLFHDNW